MIAEVMENERGRKESIFSRLKKLLKKRWAYPAIYIASAALILTGSFGTKTAAQIMQLIQKSLNYENARDVPGNDFGEPAVEVNRSMENVDPSTNWNGSCKMR